MAAPRFTAFALLVVVPGLAVGQTTELVSLGDQGQQGNGASQFPSVSCYGDQVAFVSWADNLVPGPGGYTPEVFVRDRLGSTTEWLSVTPQGTAADGESNFPAISCDGRFVSFSSHATNLVAGDTNGLTDIFVRDRVTATTERVSVATGGGQAAGGSYSALSADGRCVAFDSASADLVAGDTNGLTDVFVRDRQTGTTERVSVATGGGEANLGGGYPSISGDGRFVAFESAASNLVVGDGNSRGDVFVHDRQTGATERVSVSSGGLEANGDSGSPALSLDGRYVVFVSVATNLVAADTNGVADVFLHDRDLGTTERVSVGPAGEEGNNQSSEGRVSADGRYVVFPSEATNLVAGDTNGASDVFVRDRVTGTTALVSVSTTGAVGNGWSFDAVIASDGRTAVFRSPATDLVAGDANAVSDIFARGEGLSFFADGFETGDTSRWSVTSP